LGGEVGTGNKEENTALEPAGSGVHAYKAGQPFEFGMVHENLGFGLGFN
jgi:hypothetical protein